jgi:tRNA (adenine22-N1)-methyltransferase
VSIHLSERLQRIASYIPAGSRVVDVGTDHALLPIYLVESGRTDGVIATDVVPGPVQAAQTNVEKYGLSHLISVRCGDGLETVRPGEVDTVVIAGMGGGTAVSILQQSMDVVKFVDRLVIQPMNASRQVREFLSRTGFGLEDECLFIDDGRYYEVIVSSRRIPPDQAYASLGDDEATHWMAMEYGPCILQDGGEVLDDYLREQYGAMQDMLRGIEQGKTASALAKKEVVQRHLEWLCKWMELKGGIV